MMGDMGTRGNHKDYRTTVAVPDSPDSPILVNSVNSTPRNQESEPNSPAIVRPVFRRKQVLDSMSSSPNSDYVDASEQPIRSHGGSSMSSPTLSRGKSAPESAGVVQQAQHAQLELEDVANQLVRLSLQKPAEAVAPPTPSKNETRPTSAQQQIGVSFPPSPQKSFAVSSHRPSHAMPKFKPQAQKPKGQEHTVPPPSRNLVSSYSLSGLPIVQHRPIAPKPAALPTNASKGVPITTPKPEGETILVRPSGSQQQHRSSSSSWQQKPGGPMMPVGWSTPTSSGGARDKPSAPRTLSFHKPNAAYWKMDAKKRASIDNHNARDSEVVVVLDDDSPLRNNLTNSTSSSSQFRLRQDWRGAATEVQDLLDSACSGAVRKLSRDVEAIEVSKDLKVTLKEYQQEGLNWLVAQEKGPDKGGILADDMGLGKTIQTISLILSHPPVVVKQDTSSSSSSVTSKSSESAEKPRKTTLIIAPLPLVTQWANELQNRSTKGALKVLVHHGPKRTRDPAKLESADVVVTTFAVVVSDVFGFSAGRKKPKKKAEKGKVLVNMTSLRSPASDEDDDDYEDDYGDDSIEDSEDDVKDAKSGRRQVKEVSGVLGRCKFYRVVIDEAHTIRNRRTRGFQACCMLNSKYRICLSGTPIQNNVEELQSLLEFLRIQPYMDIGRFKRDIAVPLTRGDRRAVERFRDILGRVMLRRTKTTVINGKPIVELPARNVELVRVKMSSLEEAFYVGLEERIRKQVKQIIRTDASKQMMNMLSLLLRLRQACDHPCLVGGVVDEKVPTGADGRVNQEAMDELSEMMNLMDVGPTSKRCAECMEQLAEDYMLPVCLKCKAASTYPNIAVLGKDNLLKSLQDDWVTSTKIDKVVGILKAGRQERPDEKWIIFSQFTTMLDILSIPLKAAGFSLVRYDGAMPNPQREKSLSDFRNNSGITVCLISLMCGSLGLNLTCANNVILYDIWWNPMVEDQAIDRVHRIGQIRPVNVHRLTMMGTVEDRILALQEKKRALVAETIGDMELSKKSKKLTTNEVLALFYE